VAARITAGMLAEANRIRTDLQGHRLWDLPPEPGETSVAVDDKPIPFATPLLADRFLRGTGPSSPPPGSWKDYRDYVAARAYRVASELAADALPGLTVVGTGDGLSRDDRARRIDECLHCKRPVAVVKPIDGITRFLSVDGEGRYASVAIVARNLQHVAIAVGTGSTIALGTHHQALVQRRGEAWIPADELPVLPALRDSCAAPYGTPGYGGLQAGTLIPEWGNSIMVSGLLLGTVEAAYQPQNWPCDSAGVYIAMAAGRTTIRAITGRRLIHPYQVQAFVISALRKGEKVPGFVVARDELAAHRLFNHLRGSGIG
jgi:hypothetical protein